MERTGSTSPLTQRRPFELTLAPGRTAELGPTACTDSRSGPGGSFLESRCSLNGPDLRRTMRGHTPGAADIGTSCRTQARLSFSDLRGPDSPGPAHTRAGLD